MAIEGETRNWRHTCNFVDGQTMRVGVLLPRGVSDQWICTCWIVFLCQGASRHMIVFMEGFQGTYSGINLKELIGSFRQY